MSVAPEYCKLLEQTTPSELTQTTLKQLLGARGHYTVFAPTNEAIQTYLDSLKNKGLIEEANWDGFHDYHKHDSIRDLVVLNSVIDMGDDREALQTCDFPDKQDAEIVFPTMYERKVTVHYGSNSDIYINEALVDPEIQDVTLTNGVVHCMRDVAAPSLRNLGDFIKQTLENKTEGFYVACMLAAAAGLSDTLGAYIDPVYEMMYKSNLIPKKIVLATLEHRYFGYTLFAETDAFWSREIGKPALEITIEDVRDYLVKQGVYPDAKNDEDYESEDNLINQFITYHLLPQRLNTDRLSTHGHEYGYSKINKTPTVPVWDFYVTMGKRRLLKLYESRESNGIYLNRFAVLDNGRRGTYHELYCKPGNEGILIGAPDVKGDKNLRNAMIYPLDKLLVYSKEVRNEMGDRRVRFDLASIFPEVLNSDARGITDFSFPSDDVYQFCADLNVMKGATFNYRHYSDAGVYQGDQFPGSGRLDIIIRMPPVPRAGMYEVRSFQHGASDRSMYQFYWGTDPENLPSAGLPIDFRVGGEVMYVNGQEHPSHMGWEADTEDDDYNAEVDKKLRNNDYMKGPKYITNEDGSYNQRETSSFSRRILFRQYIDPDKTYYIRFKSCLDDAGRSILLDYFEYAAKEVYDNPETPEDIW